MSAAALSSEEHIREEVSLPSVDFRALARRAALPAALVVVAAGAVLLLGGPLRTFGDALRRATEADPIWAAGAAGFELLSFVGYIALLWLVGGRVSSRIGPRESMQLTLGGAAATRLLPTAGAGGAALTLWALRRSGLSTGRASRTLSAFVVLLYAVFLMAIAVTGTLLALEGEGSFAVTVVPAAGAVLVMVLALTFGALGPASDAGRVRTGVGVFGAGVRDAIRHVLSPDPRLLGAAVGDGFGFLRAVDPRLLGAVAWWGFDMAVLWSMLHAFGAPPAFAIVVLAYFVGQVANTIPIPGSASGGLVGVLLVFGVAPDLAIASVLAYRAIAIWLPAPIGLAALGGLRHTIARWGAEDSAVAARDEVAAPALAIVAAHDQIESHEAAPALEVVAEPVELVPARHETESREAAPALTVVPPASRPRPWERRVRERWPCREPAAA
jgi:uncharacterized membrane protein YbhN (UPF0104 family)